MTVLAKERWLCGHATLVEIKELVGVEGCQADVGESGRSGGSQLGGQGNG